VGVDGVDERAVGVEDQRAHRANVPPVSLRVMLPRSWRARSKPG
jgi:hypothetical protein